MWIDIILRWFLFYTLKCFYSSNQNNFSSEVPTPTYSTTVTIFETVSIFFQAWALFPKEYQRNDCQFPLQCESVIHKNKAHLTLHLKYSTPFWRVFTLTSTWICLYVKLGDKQHQLSRGDNLELHLPSSIDSILTTFSHRVLVWRISFGIWGLRVGLVELIVIRYTLWNLWNKNSLWCYIM